MKVIAISLSLMLSSVAMADPWTGKTKIKWLYPAASGFHFGTQEYANSDLSSCDHGTRFHIPLDHPNYNALVSSMLAAFAADKQINININGEEGKSCSPSINRFFVHK
ncbi:hypothetical protein [Marinagarivorans algicola]|uniref:hypothetical protein n=1 Tax=Marinagarivorans algicola TaxID=1513270 RepID=UPI003734ECB9